MRVLVLVIAVVLSAGSAGRSDGTLRTSPPPQQPQERERPAAAPERAYDRLDVVHNDVWRHLFAWNSRALDRVIAKFGDGPIRNCDGADGFLRDLYGEYAAKRALLDFWTDTTDALTDERWRQNFGNLVSLYERLNQLMRTAYQACIQPH